MRDSLIGVSGTVASFGLGELHLIFGILAGLSTTIYMALSIRRELSRRRNGK